MAEAPIRFTKSYHQELKRLTARHQSMMVRVIGRLSKDGHLTLCGIEKIK